MLYARGARGVTRHGNVINCILSHTFHMTLHSIVHVPRNGVQSPQTLFPHAGDVIHPVLWNRGLVYETSGPLSRVMVVRAKVGVALRSSRSTTKILFVKICF